MKKTVKIAFCGMMAALSVAIMLLAYFPYFTYAVPALAGFLIIVVYVEAGAKWAFSVYAVTAALCFIFAEPEAKFMYILVLGYYPLLKVYIERIKLRVVQYILKLAVFNAAVAIIYGVLAAITGISLDGVDKYGIYGIVGMALLANVTFLLYDTVLVRAAGLYMKRLHGTVRRIFK